MKPIQAFEAALLSLLLLSGCGSDSLTGTGSQSGNARTVAVVLLPDGRPAGGAVVTMRPGGFRADTVDDSHGGSFKRWRVDSNGGIALDTVLQYSQILEISLHDTLAVLYAIDPRNLSWLTPADSVLLGRRARMSGTVDPVAFNRAQAVYAYVDGTDLHTRVHADGSWQMDGVPAGDSLVVSFVAFDHDTVVQSRVALTVRENEVALEDTIVVYPEFVQDTLIVRHILDHND